MSEQNDPKESRRRIRVPAKDRTVNAWMDDQDDLSASLRLVVRDYIRRNGMGDVMCQPVVQEPRRGRPPKIEDEADAGVAQDQVQDSDDDEETVDEVEVSPKKSSVVPSKKKAKPSAQESSASDELMDMLNG